MHSIRIRIWPKQQRAIKTNKNKSSNPCQGLSPWVHHSWYQLIMIRGWWSAISIILPWSGVGSQLLTSSSHDLGWWSTINSPPRSTKPTLRKKRINFKEEQHFRRAAAALLSSSSQQLFSAAFLSGFSQLTASQQPSPTIILLWSGVGGQLATFLSSHPQLSSCCGQGLVVS